MGTAIAVIDGLLRRLDSCSHRLGIPSRLDEGLRRAKLTLCTLQLALARAPEEQSSEMGVWMGKIKHSVYQLEDFLDDLEDCCSIGHHGSGCVWMAMLWSLSPLFLHTSVVSRLNTINRNLESLVRASSLLSFRQHMNQNCEQYKAQVKLDVVSVLGRDSEKHDIQDLLLQNTVHKLFILPIVGHPGIGKTSLARLVFEDKREGWHFDLRIWINMNKNFDLKKIALSVISDARKSAVKGILQGSMNYETLDTCGLIKDSVQEILLHSSCLIVLDNLLRVDQYQLDNLMEMLGTKQKCTMVIVTTSNEKVAEIMHTVPSCKLGVLSEDDCWAIFCERAFGKGDVKVDPEYIEIGKEIVKRCEGIPMLAQSLGSMVHNRRVDAWFSARDDELWELEQRLPIEAKLFASFKEIFYSIPQALKSCFLYLSVFPKGSYIDKGELIRHWTALDMLRSKHGTIPTFVLGEIYIKQLLSLSLLEIGDMSLVNEMKCGNGSVFLRTHNLVYDFLRYIAKMTFSFWIMGGH